MAKIIVNNPRQVINGGAKKYYFKVKGLGGPKGDKGDTGATGPQGPQGPQGNAATVSVGSTTTLPVGQDATVQNVGTLYNAVLNFGIPQGPRGPQGATGATGAKGDKGDQGNPGPQGEKGTNATVYVGTTSTLNPGTQARVYNSGTDSNAVLNFEIPRGDVGPSVPLVQETGYSTTEAMSQNATTEALNGKQNTLTAGSNIQISGSTISATDTKYSAGNGITLTGTQFSANTSVLATKNDLGSYYTKTQIDSQMAAKQDDLVAGSNIQIAPDGKTISATDTKYTNGNGLNLNGTEFSADTDVLATKEDLDNYYTKTETDTKLAPKLEAEVLAELPTTGEEGKLYLTPKAHTTQTATGNPITATVAEDAGALESFQLDGDTFQQSYTGKNLLGASLATMQSKNTGGTWSNGAYTQYGVTVTPVFSNGLLQRIELSGTATSNFTFIVAKSYSKSEFEAIVTAGETYTLSGCPSGGSPTTYYLRVLENPYKNLYTDTGEGITKQMPSISSGATQVWLLIGVDSGTNTTGLVYRPQFEKSATATSFEPYVGGVPSPNPDYPQAIQTVTGMQTVEVVGKNIFNPEATPWVQKVAYDANGEKVTWTGYYGIAEYQPVVPNTTYYFSNSLGKGIYYGLVYYDANREKISIVTSTTRTFTTPANCYYIRFAIGSNVTEAPTWTQLELGSTATSYTPYSKQTLPISLGSIELCKLGTYQDYIYKDGDDWKVHKATNTKFYDGTNQGFNYRFSTGVSGKYRFQLYGSVEERSIPKSNSGLYFDGLCNETLAGSRNMTFSSQYSGDNVIAPTAESGYGYIGLVYVAAISEMTLDEANAWLTTHNLTVKYALATPTDTTITDTTLVTQLEAIRTASLQNGANTITNSTPAPNLAGDMEIGYYGFNPTNRYDKFIWLNLNNNYEQIGGE